MTFLALLVDNIDQSVTSSDFTHFFLFSGIVWIRLLLVGTVSLQSKKRQRI